MPEAVEFTNMAAVTQTTPSVSSAPVSEPVTVASPPPPPPTQQPSTPSTPSSVVDSLRRKLSSSLNKLDKATTVDDRKWTRRAKKGVQNLRTVVSRDASTTVGVAATTATTTPIPLATSAIAKEMFMFPAASDLLYKYESEWLQLHAENVDIVQHAAMADKQIQAMSKQCEDTRAQLDRLAAQTKQLPLLVDAIDKASALIVDLGRRIEVIEKLYDDMEAAEEQAAFIRWANTQTKQTQAYVSSKQRDLKAHEFLLKKQQSDLEKAAQAERQRQLEEQLAQQIEEFRNKDGGKPRSLSVSSVKSVHDEQVELAKVDTDVKPEEVKALDEFLETAVAVDRDVNQAVGVDSIDVTVAAEQIVEIITQEESP